MMRRKTVQILLVEFTMIVSEPILRKSHFRYDSDFGFGVRPYSQGSNLFGFNDRDYPFQKDTNDFRILVVGDSFSWAGGREGNYTAILERLFEKYVRFMVVIIPDEFQVDQNLFKRILERFSLEQEDFDLALGQKLLIDYLDSKDIPHVDLLPDFQEAGSEVPLYAFRNTHWNNAGDQLAAEILFESLKGVLEN